MLLDKKYALPYRVLDALVAHFLRFAGESRQLPVVWHQSLLTFVQRYKRELAAADKERLRSLVGGQRHYLMTPEVLRELSDGQSRCVADAAQRASRLKRPHLTRFLTPVARWRRKCRWRRHVREEAWLPSPGLARRCMAGKASPYSTCRPSR